MEELTLGNANTRTCFKCEKEGHFMKDCLENDTKQEKANA